MGSIGLLVLWAKAVEEERENTMSNRRKLRMPIMCVTSINETILLIPRNNITTYEGDGTLRRAS